MDLVTIGMAEVASAQAQLILTAPVLLHQQAVAPALTGIMAPVHVGVPIPTAVVVARLIHLQATVVAHLLLEGVAQAGLTAVHALVSRLHRKAVTTYQLQAVVADSIGMLVFVLVAPITAVQVHPTQDPPHQVPAHQVTTG